MTHLHIRSIVAKLISHYDRSKPIFVHTIVNQDKADQDGPTMMGLSQHGPTSQEPLEKANGLQKKEKATFHPK